LLFFLPSTFLPVCFCFFHTVIVLRFVSCYCPDFLLLLFFVFFRLNVCLNVFCFPLLRFVIIAFLFSLLGVL
jgi:hypothetical protein